MSHDRPRSDDAILAPAEAAADALEQRRLAASSAAPGRGFKVADVAKLLGRSRTQTDEAVVGGAASIGAPGHQAGQAHASARAAVVACSSSGAS